MATIDESGLAVKIRDRPISDRLRRVLLAAGANAGVDVVYVASVGQPGSSGKSVGSNRHDGGNAADLELIAGGRTLNFTAPGDLATFCRFVAAAAASGATGIGAGAGWLLGAVGVIGLVKSIGSASPDSYLEALDKFREMVPASADPGLNQVLDAVQQGLEAAKPAIEDAVRRPPFHGILSAAGRMVPGPIGSLVTLGLGIVIHRFGAKFTQRRL